MLKVKPNLTFEQPPKPLIKVPIPQSRYIYAEVLTEHSIVAVDGTPANKSIGLIDINWPYINVEVHTVAIIMPVPNSQKWAKHSVSKDADCRNIERIWQEEVKWGTSAMNSV